MYYRLKVMKQSGKGYKKFAVVKGIGASKTSPEWRVYRNGKLTFLFGIDLDGWAKHMPNHVGVFWWAKH